MAFDMGFNFRGSDTGITDASYQVPVHADDYPTTYTNVDGYSINAGWTSTATIGPFTRLTTNDPRICGSNFGHTSTFQIALDSGSAPGAGDYAVDHAGGDPSFEVNVFATIKDDTTTLIDLTNAGSGYTTAAGHWIDAAGSDLAATTNWTGTQVNVTFASTTANIVMRTGSPNGFLAHFRLTLQEAVGGMGLYRLRRRNT